MVRLIRAMDLMDKLHPARDHFYLQFIGVHPGSRGLGLGQGLMQPMISPCGEQGCGIYLENTKEGNLDFYSMLGFVVMDEITIGKGSPPLWLMWREPAAAEDIIVRKNVA